MCQYLTDLHDPKSIGVRFLDESSVYLHGFIRFLSIALDSIDPRLNKRFLNRFFPMDFLFEISKQTLLSFMRSIR